MGTAGTACRPSAKFPALKAAERSEALIDRVAQKRNENSVVKRALKRFPKSALSCSPEVAP
jgi:hypothetical protein